MRLKLFLYTTSNKHLFVVTTLLGVVWKTVLDIANMQNVATTRQHFAQVSTNRVMFNDSECCATTG